MNINEIEKIFINIINLLNEIKEQNKISCNVLMKLERIINNPNIEPSLLSLLKESMINNPIQYKRIIIKRKETFYNPLPIELLEGNNITLFYDKVLPSKNIRSITDSRTNYTLEELSSINDESNKIIFANHKLYEYAYTNERLNSKDSLDSYTNNLLTNLLWDYDYYKKDKEYIKYSLYLYIYDKIKEILFRHFNPGLENVKKLNSELAFKINYFDNIYFYDKEWIKTDNNYKKIFIDRFTRKDNKDYIDIKIANLINHFIDSYEISKGILRFTKTIPVKIIPININPVEEEYILKYFNEYGLKVLNNKPELFRVLTNSAKSIDDLFFLDKLTEYKKNEELFILEKPIVVNEEITTEYYSNNQDMYKFIEGSMRDGNKNPMQQLIAYQITAFFEDDLQDIIEEKIVESCIRYNYIFPVANYLSPHNSKKVEKIRKKEH